MGEVHSIHIASDREGMPVPVEAVRAVPGHGLEGDRYFKHEGTFSKDYEPKREVTFIESEAIDAIARDYDIKVGYGEPRRNIVTQGIALNHLVDREFNVGDVRLRGIKLCEPCLHMEKLTNKAGIRDSLLHRGGLRAQILTEGTIRVGDAVRADS